MDGRLGVSFPCSAEDIEMRRTLKRLSKMSPKILKKEYSSLVRNEDDRYRSLERWAYGMIPTRKS